MSMVAFYICWSLSTLTPKTGKESAGRRCLRIRCCWFRSACGQIQDTNIPCVLPGHLSCFVLVPQFLEKYLHCELQCSSWQSSWAEWQVQGWEESGVGVKVGGGARMAELSQLFCREPPFLSLTGKVEAGLITLVAGARISVITHTL